MSITSRLENIQQTHQQYLTLIGIEDRADELASNNLNIGGYSEYQRMAAVSVVETLGLEQPATVRSIDAVAEVLYVCAATRPPALKWNDNNLRHYENWRNQHNDSNLAQTWINEIQAMSNRKLEEMASHLRVDDVSNEVFVTSFKEGSVHRHDGQHGDLMDFVHA
jgi:hypothetical protein